MLGFVSFDLEGDFKNFTFEDLKDKMCVAYAGRAAQIKKFGNKGLDSGATNDLAMAMRCAYMAIAHFGMDEELGYINNTELNLQSIEQQIQARLSILVREMMDKTKKLVDENWQDIEKVAKVLVKEEFLDEKQFYKILSSIH
jgi:ATP-dependent Zn protease